MVLGLEFQVPIFVIQGTEDDYTPPRSAGLTSTRSTRDERLPCAIDGAGHFAIVSRPDEFLNAMKARLRQTPAISPPARARKETFSSVVANAVFVDTGASPMTPK